VSGKAYMLTTNDTGYVTQPLNLVAVGGEATTYQIRAVFEGAGFKTRNLTVTDPYGQDYLVCTTLQWDFKASQNSVTLMVEAPKTDTTSSTSDENATVTQNEESTTATIPPPKTQEEMQAEAEQGGWLQIWPEFSWWYPWFRLHVKVNVNPMIHVAFNPILPGGEELWLEGLEIFANVVADIWQDVVIDLVGVFISYAVAKGLSIWNLAGGLIAEGIKGAVQYGLFFNEFFRATNGSLVMLAAGIANIIMGLVAIATNIGEAFVRALYNILWAPVLSAVMFTTSTMIAIAAPFQAVRTAVDYVESVVIDFPIAILALLKYLGKI